MSSRCWRCDAQLPWWQQAVAVAGLVGVGLLVVSVKIIAH